MWWSTCWRLRLWLLLLAHIFLDILVDIKRRDLNHVVTCDRLRLRPLTTRKLNLITLVIQLLSQPILHLGRSVEGVDLIWGHNFTLLLSGIGHGFLHSWLLFGTYVSVGRILNSANLDVVNVFNFDLTIIFRIHIVHGVPNIRPLLDELAISTWLDPASIHLLAVLADFAPRVLSDLGSLFGWRCLVRILSDRLSWALGFLDQRWFVWVLGLSWLHGPLKADIVDAGKSGAWGWNLTVLVLSNTSRWSWVSTRTQRHSRRCVGARFAVLATHLIELLLSGWCSCLHAGKVLPQLLNLLLIESETPIQIWGPRGLSSYLVFLCSTSLSLGREIVHVVLCIFGLLMRWKSRFSAFWCLNFLG